MDTFHAVKIDTNAFEALITNFSKGFDSVSLGLLTTKLEWLKFFLAGTHIRTRINNSWKYNESAVP